MHYIYFFIPKNILKFISNLVMAAAELPISTVGDWKRKAFELSDLTSDTLVSVFSRTLESISVILKDFEPRLVERALKSLDFERSNCIQLEESDEPSIRYLMFGIIESLHLTLTHLTEGKKVACAKAQSTIKEWKKKCVEFSDQSTDALVSVISKGFDAMFNIVKNSELSHIRRALRALHFERSLSFRDENIEELSLRSLMYGVIESIHLVLLHLTENIEKLNQPKSSAEKSNIEKQFPISVDSIDSSDTKSTHSVDRTSMVPTFTTNFLSRPKEEPIELSQSIPQENKKSAMKTFREVMKDEEMENNDMPLGSDFNGDEIKEENTLNDEMELKDEPIDPPLLDDDQKFDLNSIGDEFEFKDESLLNGNTGKDLGRRNSVADDVIDNGEEKEGTVDTADNTPGSFDNEFFSGDDMESMNEPILNEDMGNEEGFPNSSSGDQIENDGGDKEAVGNKDNIPKDSSDETVEVEKRRRSNRNISGRVKYTDYMEESDREEEPSVKKKRSESVESMDKKERQSSSGRSHLKSVKKDNHQIDNEKEKNKLECPECEFRSSSVSTWVTHLKSKHSTNPALAGCLIRCDCGHESHSNVHSYECDISNFTIIRIGNGPIRRLTDTPVTPQCVLCKMHPKSMAGYTQHLAKHHKSTLNANRIYLKCACEFTCTSNRYVNHDKKCTGREFTLHKVEED